jgi:hypothetical protein
MKKKRKGKLIFFLVSFIVLALISSFFFINSIINKDNFQNLKSLFSYEQKLTLKRYFFPSKLNLRELEVIKKKIGSEIGITESNVNLSNNKLLKKYKLNLGFYAGIRIKKPGSGYIDFFENNIFILSSRGILAYREKLTNDEKNFKQIKNNINDFIGINQFNYLKSYSLKDMLIFNNKIFISFTEEITKHCWNTSIIYGTINYKKIKFKKLFTPNKCISADDNSVATVHPLQSGGRIVNFDDDHILLSIGDWGQLYLAQDEKSVNGSIIKININNSSYEIISIGHRNPQGLYFDKENNFLLETEHGPDGGDEINLIQINQINKDKILNYGWAIASYGEHYGGKADESNQNKYKLYPLYKSHSKYGFIEPLKSFNPSIAISEIVKIEKNKYVVSSLKDKSLYFFELNEEKKIINLDRIEVFERIRDLKFYENKLYLFMESTASIGVINLN